MFQRISFGILALLLASPSRAAVVIVEKSSLAKGGPGGTTTLQIDGNRVRIDSTSTNRSQSFIFLGDRDLFLIVDPQAKTYREMTKADLERMSGQLGDLMKQLEEKLKAMPPDQRKALEGLFAGKLGGRSDAPQPITYRKVASSAKVGRWTCDRYEGYRSDQKIWELCVADWKQVGLTTDDFAVLQRLGDFFRSLTSIAGFDTRGQEPFTVGGRDAGYEGVPVQRLSFAGTVVQSTFEVTDVRRQDLPDSLFQVPPDYTRVTLPEMPAAPR